MKLWTIQHIDFYKELADKKVMRGKKDYADKDFQYAYKWMISQMEKRINNRPNDSYPIWAWFQYESAAKPKPDLKTSGFLERGTQAVRLDIEKNNDSVLLSNFELWHAPLAYKTFIGNSEVEGKEFEEYLKQTGLDKENFLKLSNNHKPPNNIKTKIIGSWDKIFDLNFDCKYYTQPKANKSIQATFWELSVDEVIKVDYFIAR